MIKNTFIHINGIGHQKEKHLWSKQIFCWQDFITNSNRVFSSNFTTQIITTLSKSFKSYEDNDPTYFAKKLPNNQHWRLYPDFKEQLAYLDIETTGLSQTYDEITTIVLYDGLKIKYYVNGRNLDDFPKDIEKYKILVTYNGKCFDIPFIEEYFKITLSQIQIDLRYILHSLGYKGGLKGCERQLGLSRGELKDVDGFFAVFLWQEYKKWNNLKALETLLAYNVEDVINLEQLLIIAYNKNILKKNLTFVSTLPCVEKPNNPFNPDLDVVKEIKDKYGYL